MKRFKPAPGRAGGWRPLCSASWRPSLDRRRDGPREDNASAPKPDRLRPVPDRVVCLDCDWLEVAACALRRRHCLPWIGLRRAELMLALPHPACIAAARRRSAWRLRFARSGVRLVFDACRLCIEQAPRMCSSSPQPDLSKRISARNSACRPMLIITQASLRDTWAENVRSSAQRLMLCLSRMTELGGYDVLRVPQCHRWLGLTSDRLFIAYDSDCRRVCNTDKHRRCVYDALIFSYSLITKPAALEALEALKPQIVIADESHNLKNSRARSSRVLCGSGSDDICVATLHGAHQHI